jgi:hypothetical protein
MAGNVSYGTTFSFASTLIDDVKSVKFSGVTRQMVKRTPLASTHARKLPGRPDAGKCTVELYYNETAHNTFWSTLSAAYSSTTAPASVACDVVFPDGTTLAFNAFVEALNGPEADGEDALVATLVLDIDGAITKS